MPLLEGSLRAAVTDDGQLVNVTGGARAGLPRPGKPKLDAAAATAIAARATGGSATGAQTKLVMTAATGRVRLAWRVLRPQGAAYYDQLIDATTGEEISRRDRIDHAVPGLVYDTYPGAPIGGTARTIDLEPYLSPARGRARGAARRVSGPTSTPTTSRTPASASPRRRRATSSTCARPTATTRRARPPAAPGARRSRTPTRRTSSRPACSCSRCWPSSATTWPRRRSASTASAPASAGSTTTR